MATDSWQHVLKVAVPAGLIAGAAMGIVTRISMRGCALATGEVPAFSLGDTAAVTGVFAVVLGLPLSLIYVRFWRSIGLADGWNGLAFGAALLVTLVVIPFMVIPTDEADLRSRLMAFAVFVPVPLVYGYTLGLNVERLIARAQSRLVHRPAAAAVRCLNGVLASRPAGCLRTWPGDSGSSRPNRRQRRPRMTRQSPPPPRVAPRPPLVA